MLVKQILLTIIGLSSGILVAGGLFGFIVSLGVISDFADRTHSGNKIRVYERALALGGILGNVIDIFDVDASTLSLTGNLTIDTLVSNYYKEAKRNNIILMRKKKC